MTTNREEPAAAGIRSPALFVGRHEELTRFAAAMDTLRLALVYGVGGVGKTAFMLRATEELGARLAARMVYHKCRPGESMATVAAAAMDRLESPGASPAARARRRRDHLEALTRAALGSPIVICLDDAQLVDGPSLFEALVHVAIRRLPLWLCVASREVLPISPAEVDHLVLRLGALPPEDTRTLWTALERLYGPAAVPFDELSRQGAGNPLFLKQAFAGPVSPGGGDRMGLGRLSPLEAGLLAHLCAFRRPAPRAALLGGHDSGLAEQALQHLAGRFLVESPAPGLLAVHDLVRDAVAASARPPGTADHARCLAYYRGVAAREPESADIELEMLHHALACDQVDLAEEILVQHASYLRRLFPMGAVVERDLARAIDELAAKRTVPVSVRLLRGRIRARQGQVAQAYTEVAAVEHGGDPLAELDLGEMAYVLGRVDDAVTRLRRAADDGRLGVVARVWATMLLINSLRAQGAVETAEALFTRAARLFAQAGPIGQAARSWLLAMFAYDCERYGAAAEALTATRQWMEKAAPAAVSIPLLASLERVVGAVSGCPVTENTESDEFFDETLVLRLAARLWRAEALLHCGEVAAAAALAEQTTATATAAGYGGHELWGTLLCGEAAWMLGRPREAVARLDRVLRAPAEPGLRRERARIQGVAARALLAQGRHDAARTLALAAVRQLRRAPGTIARLRAVAAIAASAEGDPRQALARLRRCAGAEGFDAADWRVARAELALRAGRLPVARQEAHDAETLALSGGWRWLACRAGLAGAEAAFRQGDLAAAAAEWHRASAEAGERAFGLEQLRAALLGAALARARGDLPAAERLVAEAGARATAGGYEVEAEAARVAAATLAGKPAGVDSPGGRLARRVALDEALGLELRQEGVVQFLTRGQLEELDTRRHRLVVDLARGRVKIGSRWIDLSRRQALLEVARVLAARPGMFVPADALVREAWGVEYHPLRHQNRLSVVVTRLRRLLGPRSVEGGKDGYRLAAASPWAVIQPLSPAGA